MRILINGSTLVVGGGLQVGRSLLIALANNSHGHTIKNVVSNELAAVLPEDIKATTLSPSPARILDGKATRKQLREIEREFSPDVVLTIFGPSYWKPKSIHLCGFANPWTFTVNPYAWRVLHLDQRLATYLRRLYRKLILYHEKASALIVETEAMAEAIGRQWPDRVAYVVSNSCSQAFFKSNEYSDYATQLLPKKAVNEFRIVTLSQYYAHKNLEIIPEIAKALYEQNLPVDFRFYLSLDENNEALKRILKRARVLGVEKQIVSIGTVPPQRAPEFYDHADVMLLPSVLESFSANYPEAMKMGVPIVTTDLPFARSVCGDAALYFQPLDPQSAAFSILRLYRDKAISDSLKYKGMQRVKDFPTPSEKARRYIEICERVYKQTHNTNGLKRYGADETNPPRS